MSLARACYSEADIIFLDDPLSAVDSHVAKHIFERVISNKKGILKEKTRLMITNNLSLLPDVDNIIVLKDGRISETGTYTQLMENKGDFSDFVNEFSSKTVSNGPLVARQESVISNKSFVRSSSIEQSGQIESKENDQIKLIESEKAETGEVKFAIYLRYFKSMTFLWFFLLVFGMVGMTIASVGSNVWLAIWSDDPLPVNGTYDSDLRDLRLGVYGGLGAAQGKAYNFFYSFNLIMFCMIQLFSYCLLHMQWQRALSSHHNFYTKVY